MSGGGWGNTTCATATVSVSGGNLVLTLASSSSGGCVPARAMGVPPRSAEASNAGSGSYNLPVGGYTEARINFPGSGTGIYNLARVVGLRAELARGRRARHRRRSWPVDRDVCYFAFRRSRPRAPPRARGRMPSTSMGSIGRRARPRSTTTGKWSRRTRPDDNGAPESLLVDVMDGYGQAVYGAGSQVLGVDYIRAWQ